jgi:predicted RNase H-like nuclease
MSDRVAGIDWYRGAWVATVLQGRRKPAVLVDPDLKSLIDRIGEDTTCIAIDMPIGLPTGGPREADRAARDFVGPRRNSVFPTPPAEVLNAESYPRANDVAQDLLGHKISKQSYALAKNIALVAEIAAVDKRIIEAHPEVSFCAMAQAHLQWAKTTWNGQMQRRRLLAQQRIALPDDLGEAAAVPVADVLDSAAAAWTARRYARGHARSCPAGAQRDQIGVIWY